MAWKYIVSAGLLLLLLPKTVVAVPPVPAVIAGTLTMNGEVLTQSEDNGYTITVTRLDGSLYLSALGSSASDLDGLNDNNWYWIDIPLFDAADQPDGANPGETGVVHVYYYDEELSVISPVNGQVVIGTGGSRTRIDIEATDTVLDSDGDGVPDSEDGCPDDSGKSNPGECGCGVADTDTDNDTVPDCNDAFPDDPTKWESEEDSDGDGVPDSEDGCPDDSGKSSPGECGCGVADTDTDNDTVPDCNDAFPDDPTKWESEEDSDGDGVPDSEDGCPDDSGKSSPGECGCGVADTDTDNDTVPDCNDAFPDDPTKWEDDDANDDNYPDDTNAAPAKPVLLYPIDSQPGIDLNPELAVLDTFYDPDPVDTHSKTEWQIALDYNFSTLVMDVTSEIHLTSLPVPHLILDANTTYYWRVRFFDNSGNESEWSDYSWFTTRSTNNDVSPANGVPDDQDVDSSVDMDNNGTPDIYQHDIRCVRTVIGDAVIGVKTANNVSMIESLISIDPSEIGDKKNMPEHMKIGAINFKVRVKDSEEPSVVIVYMSIAAPDDSKWYKLDPVKGWEDYSTGVTFSTDRKSFSLKLRDGGEGDADGIKNGIIVDPSGLVLSEVWQANHGSEDRKSSSGGGGGCFVALSCDFH